MNTFRFQWLQSIGWMSLWVGTLAIVPGAIAQTADSAIDPATPVSSVSQLDQNLQVAPASMAQVTSVSQLSDVKPTDWAYQALQSLVERYGCIVGYPDKTYRGNRATTRYEFAAGLNACLDKIQELIAAATADFVRKEDLEVVKRLQEEFAAELATIRGRIEALDVRTATLEKQQFSTTTRLSGEAIFSLSSAYGAYPGGNASFINNTNTNVLGGRTLISPAAGRDAEVVFNNRVRLNLLTSFSGKDLLITGLQAYNFGASSSVLTGAGVLPNTGNSLASTLGYGDVLFGSSSNVRLGYEAQFPTVNPQNLAVQGGNNSIQLYKLLYIFPVANKLTAFAGTSAEVSDAFPSILPWANEGQGAVSRFATLPAAHRVSGGTSQTGLASAAGFIFNIAEGIDLRALYGSVNAALPGNAGFPGTPLGAGIFNGSYVVATQLTLSPSKNFDIGLNYAHSYHQVNILGTGLSSADIGAILFNPTAGELARGGGIPLFAIADQGIQLNTFGASVAWRISPRVTLAGSATYIQSELVNVNASTNFLSWLVGFQVKDVLTKGGSAGVIFGSPLHRIGTGGRAVDPETATPYQAEGFLNIRVSDNISVTPGLFVIFNPEGFEENRTVYVPVIRTTFTF
ncbi:MAG: carbohydrate porin [Oscillatoriales cyanobacterium C42_A2020_001]|nr:carbohydrate porin [Leptolyngbyaceae cyanobacterium C42_A2020_001]